MNTQFTSPPTEIDETTLLPFLLHAPVRLAQVRRYSTLPVQRPENILEHSYMVGLIGFLIAEDMDADSGGAVLQKAIFHDMEEAVTGDITRDFKYLDPSFREALANVEPEVMRSICSKLPDNLIPSVFNTWQNSKDDSLAGQIVEIADSIAVMVYIYEETLRGNKWIADEAWHIAYPLAIQKLEQFGYTENSLASRTIHEFGDWYDNL